MKRNVPIRVISLILLTACGALCQKRSPSDLSTELQVDGSNSREVQNEVQSEVQSQEPHLVQLLTDAPSSIQASLPVERFRTFANEATSPWTLGRVGISAGVIRETGLGYVTAGPQPNLTAHYQAALIQKESGNFVGKYPYPSLLNQDLRYLPSTSSSFMGRATYAASRIFITRDDSGKGRLNTSYFLGLLSSVAGATAYRPNRMRSSSDTFNTFGSTIGGDAGMNVFHEFGPGIRQLVKSHAPKFVSRMAERITHDRTTDAFASPAK
jgi:hypothetical protein